MNKRQGLNEQKTISILSEALHFCGSTFLSAMRYFLLQSLSNRPSDDSFPKVWKALACLFVCLYLCVFVCAYGCRRAMLNVFLNLYLNFWGWLSHWPYSQWDLARLAREKVPGNIPVCCSWDWDCRHGLPCPNFPLGAGDLNSGPYACLATVYHWTLQHHDMFCWIDPRRHELYLFEDHCQPQLCSAATEKPQEVKCPLPPTLSLTTKIGEAGLEAGLPLRPIFQGEILKHYSQCLTTPSLCDGCRWALFTLVQCECSLWATWVLLSVLLAVTCQALLHTLQLPTVFFPSSWCVLVFLASVLRVLAALVSAFLVFPSLSNSLLD